MNKKIVVSLFLILLLTSVAAEMQLTNMAKANFFAYLPTITINSDGSITPETALIERTNGIYSLTSNLSQQHAIVIQCSDIVFDGKDCLINGSYAPNYPGYSNIGLSLKNVTNVTLKHVQIIGFGNRDIALQDSTNCSLFQIKADSLALYDSNCNFNEISESNIARLEIWSSNNMIARNNITESFYMTDGNSNAFLENNFMIDKMGKDGLGVGGGSGVNFWDNGSVGNYWSNYFTKYPNASEIGIIGIGDTPYIINVKNKDNFPLIAPFQVSPSPSPETQPEQHSFSIAWIIGALGLSTVLISVGLFYYRKKRTFIQN